MTRATPLTALRNAAAIDVAPAAAERPIASGDVAPRLSFSISSDLSAVESEWRRFEPLADGTPFQTFDWLAAWQRHIGAREGAIPVIVIGSFRDGRTAFILPLAVEPRRFGRRLRWLGQDLCDYTAPLLARDFGQRVTPGQFLAVWRQLCERVQADARLRFDWIDLEKMPHQVGAQANPFTALDVSPHPSGAHLTHLGDDWEQFYFKKRSSATRRHDRAKRRHLAKYGEIRFLDSASPDDARRMVETMMQQKARSFARRGIADVFARPGCREFLLDLAANATTRHLVHVSRVEIGTTWAAVNLGVVFGDCYYHFAASYDDGELAHYGPGALHLRELMAHAIERGLRRFDFTIGDESYKLEWSDTDVKLWDYGAAATWRGRPASLLATTRHRIKRFLKQTPIAWRAVCRLRAAIGSLQTPPQ